MALITKRFDYTGDVQQFQLPETCLSVTLETYGARGGGDGGGLGGKAYGKYILKPMDSRLLSIFIGGEGITHNGWNDGGNGFYSNGHGGGATDVRINGNDLSSRIIVAAGGGAGGNDSYNSPGGAGGGLTGADGNGMGFGKGATQTGPNLANGSSNYFGGGGGSSYIAQLTDSGTTAGVNSGNGYVIITYEDNPKYYFLKKDSYIYIPCDTYFDTSTNKLISIDMATVKTKMILGNLNTPLDLVKPFVVDSVTHNPADLIDFSKCKICCFSQKDHSSLSFTYTPSDTALSKTNIKIKEQYLISSRMTNYGMYLDITATDKSKIDFFLDYGQAKTYKNSSILKKEMISNSVYANFKLNPPDSLLSAITFYSKYKYKKLRENQMDVYDNFMDSAFVVFNDDYDLMLVNRIAKQEIVNYIETLDKF